MGAFRATLVCIFSRAYLLCFPFVGPLVLVVDAGEVWDDNWHGEGDHQDAREGTDAADQLAQHGAGDHVTVTARRSRA